MSKILVIDDERVVCDAVTRHLEQAGFSAHTAYNGTAALEFLESHSVDLALIDIVMPGHIDGHMLADTLRQIAPQIKTILTSGYSPHMAVAGIDHNQPFLQKALAV